MARVVDIERYFAKFSDTFSPKIVGELNGQHVKLVRAEGDKVPWHIHDHEDELFWVVEGAIEVHERDGSVTLHPGEFCIVPRGVEHMPVAEEEVHVVLFEPRSTLNTGNVRNQRTLEQLERV
jgi:mannose-6-phosphate isomerase-like protein (cupin superfamily)